MSALCTAPKQPLAARAVTHDCQELATPVRLRRRHVNRTLTVPSRTTAQELTPVSGGAMSLFVVGASLGKALLPVGVR